MLTSAPLLQHFDPSLRTAVHIDASQHAVGAVLLQWEANEQDPQPVCFLSRKLQGSQWHYDAHNAEALATQVALAVWRPLLYGVPFELVSDHAGLRHLFQQKAPSARILRLCEFLSEFDFQECQNNIAVFHDGRLFSLPVTVPMAAEVPERAANRMLRSMGVSANVELHCIGAKGNVQFWRADILQAPELPVLALPGLQWQTSAVMQRRETWRRAHFDALRLFGVLQYHAGGVAVACVGDVGAGFVIFVRAQDRTAAGPLFAECGRGGRRQRSRCLAGFLSQ
jgi:hypothetical protein